MTDQQAPTSESAKTPAALVERSLTLAQWRVLSTAIFPGAGKEAIFMAIDYCKARNLDVFKRPVHIVKVWNSAVGEEVETVWPGISELRTTAMRTGRYAGCDPAEFGAATERDFASSVKTKKGWIDRATHLTFPEWCQVTVYRKLGNERVAFPGPRVYWLETYASVGKAKDGYLAIPNSMWERRTNGQLEKCSEAAALRKAFPEELGSDYTAEEMAGQHIGAEDAKDITPTPPLRPTRADSDKPELTSQAATKSAGMDAVIADPDAVDQLYSLYDNSGEEVGEFSAIKWADELIVMLRRFSKSGDTQSFNTVWENNVESLDVMGKTGDLGNSGVVQDIYEQERKRLDDPSGAEPTTTSASDNAYDFADGEEAEKFVDQMKELIKQAGEETALDNIMMENSAKVAGVKRMGKWGMEMASAMERLHAGRLEQLTR